MDALVSLLILMFFLLVPLLPALFARAAQKAQKRAEQAFVEHRRAVAEASRQRLPSPSRPLPARAHPEYRSLEEIPARPVSLEKLPPRASALEEMLPEVPSTLEGTPEPPSPVAPEPRRLARRAPLVRLEKPSDVRRAILLATLLGRPRGAD
ncbi:hypothetical protein [Polyangium spumosum]|uniref:Uncharacterized protein n=1 Tax=Polyangium spumosum TaxID=889282 RepID=A0A6N7PR27_9BACT|nr:hypothetical protein [Polyangium spumosum]MRG94389.1 hypothetical protein [Polyangium spumosum]